MRYERLASIAVMVGVLVTGLYALALHSNEGALWLADTWVFLGLAVLALVVFIGSVLPRRGEHRLRVPGLPTWLACATLSAAVLVPGSPVVLITLRSLGVVALLEVWAARSRRRSERAVLSSGSHGP